LPVPNKEQQRKVSQLARTLLTCCASLSLDRYFVRRASPEVRACVVSSFVRMLGEMPRTSVEGITDAHYFAAVGSDGRHGMADPGVGVW
jgi:hypothetical protein